MKTLIFVAAIKVRHVVEFKTGGNFVGACVTEQMRVFHATFPATNAGNFVNI